MKKVKITEEFMGFNIKATGDVVNPSTVLNLTIFLLDELSPDQLPDRETQELIEDKVNEALINKAYCPEIEF